MQTIDLELKRTVPHGLITATAHSPRAVEWVGQAVNLGDWQGPESFSIGHTHQANAIVSGAVAAGLAVRSIDLGKVQTWNVEGE